jgi:hypothetical protein
MDITRTSIVLEDGQWAQVKRGDKMFSIRNMQREEQAVNLETIIGDISLVEKGGFDHHMMKEITRQPESLSNCLRGRVSADGRVHLGGLSAVIRHNGRDVVPLDAMRAARQVAASRAAAAAALPPPPPALSYAHRSLSVRAGPAGTRRWSESTCWRRLPTSASRWNTPASSATGKCTLARRATRDIAVSSSADLLP